MKTFNITKQAPANTIQYDETKIFDKRYASECLQAVPLGKWIDKSVGGCGLTFLALTDKNDCIILMPRKRLVQDKMRQTNKYPNLFGVLEGVKTKDVEEYIRKCRQNNLPIKIVTTYDSFALGKMDFLLSDKKLGILVDECQYVTEPSKKDIELGRAFHKRLKENIERVSFFSAAPPRREYLPEYIQQMPSIKYIWTRQIDVTPYIYDTKRPFSAVAKVLKRMVEQGEFEIDKDVKFKKAIVFVNSVSAIVDIAEAINQPYNVGYIVGDTVKNSMRLSQVATEVIDGTKLPMITIGTSSMLAGIDLEDTETFNIIVSSTTKDWTLFDTELDIPQAIARQRLDENPNNDKFLFIYSKDDYEARIVELEETYQKDINKVNLAVSNINVLMQNGQEVSDAFDKYKAHYVIENGIATADYSLLNINKYKFQELYRQYKEGFKVMSNKKELNSLKIANISLSKSYEEYVEEVKEIKSKSELVTLLESMKNKEWKEYLEYGIKTGKILSNVTEAKMHFNSQNDYASVVLYVRNTFKVGEFYSNADAKNLLANIYKKKGVKKTAKATDLNEFAEIKGSKKRTDGQEIKGVIITRYK